MINGVIHSAPARLLRGLVGVAVFVQGSQYVSGRGILALAIGAFLIITAGADVAPRPADTPGNV